MFIQLTAVVIVTANTQLPSKLRELVGSDVFRVTSDFLSYRAIRNAIKNFCLWLFLPVVTAYMSKCRSQS